MLNSMIAQYSNKAANCTIIQTSLFLRCVLWYRIYTFPFMNHNSWAISWSSMMLLLKFKLFLSWHLCIGNMAECTLYMFLLLICFAYFERNDVLVWNIKILDGYYIQYGFVWGKGHCKNLYSSLFKENVSKWW